MMTESYPLSPMQRGMLYQYLLAPTAGVDVEQLVTTVRHPLDTSCLRAAWATVARRHAILRTSFEWEGLDEPRQCVHPSVGVDVHELDWRTAPESEQDRRLSVFLQEDRRRGFDLSVAPIMRLTVVRVADEVSHVVWTFHHILMDGRSFRIVLREAFDFYDAECAGGVIDLPEPPPYRAYIDWVDRRTWDDARSFWTAKLAGFSSPTALPFASPAATEPGIPVHATERQWLSAEATARLVATARDNGLTMNSLVQGAWALLLARYSREEDIVFGAVRACRRTTVDGADSMIGLFINTVPMRVRVDPDRPLVEWLRDLRTQWREIRDYEHTPLVEIQKWLALPRGVPLFHSILMFEEYLLDRWLKQSGPAWAARDTVSYERPGFPITIKAYDGPALSLQTDFDPSRVTRATAAQMLEHLKNVLEGMASAGLGGTVGAVQLCSDRERIQLLVDWNDTADVQAPGGCVHDLFSAQAGETPHAPAVIAGESVLSYRELDRQSNALANRLRSIGVGPDVCVGICLERSPRMMIAVLGILKAGGAYVPLDPSYPSERLGYMLENARARVVVTQRELRGCIPACGAELVSLDDDTVVEGDPAPVPSTATRENLAYVIYTSGSTGKPKGVAMPHRALVNLIAWQLRRSRLAGGAATLQFSSLSFDVSFQELFSTWASGGALVLITETLRRDPQALLALMRQRSVQRVFLPFIALQQLAEVAFGGAPPPESLREVITAGEQLQVTPQLIQFFAQLPDCRLCNQYGPTESHVVTEYTLSGAPKNWPALPPIGRPISNARIYLLDPNLNPVPVGIAGELHIAGVCLAHGYLHRPDLTDQRFVADPFGPPGERMYKTGDLARYLPSGDIEYLGRMDDQVKVRGYRVELGEIEAVLSTHTGIRECAVTVRDIAPAGKQLVAYVVTRDDPGPSRAEFVAYLDKTLPEHMIPSRFVRLDRLPLTPSGKVERRSLPAPPDDEGLPARPIAEPRDLTELQLLMLWERLLGRRGIDLHDDFFELGGHSILAVRLFSQIQKVFGRSLPLVTLFQAPTVAQLAERLRDSSEGSWGSVVALQALGSRKPLFLVPGGGGILLAYRDLIGHLPPDQPVYGFQPASLRGTSAHAETIEEMASAYVRSMQSVQPHGPYSLHGWCIGGIIAFEMAQQLEAAGEQVDLLVMVDSTFPRSSRPTIRERLAYHARTATRGRPIEGLRYVVRQSWRVPRARAQRVVAWARDLILRARRSTASATPIEWVERYVLDAEMRAASRYRPRPYRGRLTLFWPTTRPTEAYVNSPASWTELARGGVEHHDIPGTHHSMYLEPEVRHTARTLADSLDRARAQGDDRIVPSAPVGATTAAGW